MEEFVARITWDNGEVSMHFFKSSWERYEYLEGLGDSVKKAVLYSKDFDKEIIFGVLDRLCTNMTDYQQDIYL